MDDEERGFAKTLSEIIKKEDILALRKFSSKSIRTASYTNSKCLVDLSIISYVFSKFLTGEHYKKDEDEFSKMKTKLTGILDGISNSDKTSNLETIFSEIKRFDELFGRFSEETVSKARVKKASTLYSLGVSIGQASMFTGASESEIMRFSGSTKITDEEGQTQKVIDRIKHARSVM